MRNLIESINNNLNESVEEDLNQIGNQNNMYADIVNTLKNNITDYSDRNEVRGYLYDLIDNEGGLIKAGFNLDNFIETYKEDVTKYVDELNYFKQKALLNELIGYSNDFGALILRTDTDEYNHNLAISIISSIINDIYESI